MAEPGPLPNIDDLIRRALAEDIGAGDATTDAIVDRDRTTHGAFVAKGDLVVSGLPVACAVLAAVDPAISWQARSRDGEVVAVGAELAVVSGPARALLAAERTALNFLQHLSGIATTTRMFVEHTGGSMTILDTRKTIPGLRALAKYAVRCGGARNHRMGLHDGILIKDNHIRIAGSIAEAVRRVRAAGVSGSIEVEAQSLDQVDAALVAGVDIIMLDNLPDADIREAVRRIGGRARTEVSGNMTLARIGSLADSGVTFASVGALTHSAPAADISLELAL